MLYNHNTQLQKETGFIRGKKEMLIVFSKFFFLPEFNLSALSCPCIIAWVDHMWKNPVVQHCKIEPELLTQHYALYRKGRPDFTIGADGKAAPSQAAVPEALENLDGLREAHTRDRQK